MLICNGIIDHLALSAVLDQVHLFKDPELMRDRGVGHSEKCRYVAHAHLVAEQRKKYLKPCKVSEHLEGIRKIHYRLILRHALFDLAHNVIMDHIDIAAFDFIKKLCHFAAFPFYR